MITLLRKEKEALTFTSSQVSPISLINREAAVTFNRIISIQLTNNNTVEPCPTYLVVI